MLPLRSNIPEIAKFTLERIDPAFYAEAKSVLDSGRQGCLIAGGENYGQGSSREHAALAPMYLGVRVILAKSFARIHRANLINYGILPLVFADPENYDALAKGDVLTLSGIEAALANGSDFVIQCADAAGNTKFSFTSPNDFDERSRKILAKGGLGSYTKSGGQ